MSKKNNINILSETKVFPFFFFISSLLYTLSFFTLQSFPLFTKFWFIKYRLINNIRLNLSHAQKRINYFYIYFIYLFYCFSFFCYTTIIFFLFSSLFIQTNFFKTNKINKKPKKESSKANKFNCWKKKQISEFISREYKPVKLKKKV